MRLNRFIGDFELSGKEVEITDLDQIKQIKSVLRMEIGDRILLSNGKGTSAEVSIFQIEKGKITCMIESLEKTKEENRKVNLYLAILKKENFELAVQKAVECGVVRIIPIVTERTVKTGLNFERLEKIILEACEQSGRNIVPQLFPILPFKDALIEGSQAEEKIIFDVPDENQNNPYSPNQKANEVSIFIGPEGGFTEKEINLAQDSSYSVASLGNLTLRGETAAIIATYRAVNAI